MYLPRVNNKIFQHQRGCIKAKMHITLCSGGSGGGKTDSQSSVTTTPSCKNSSNGVLLQNPGSVSSEIVRRGVPGSVQKPREAGKVESQI